MSTNDLSRNAKYEAGKSEFENDTGSTGDAEAAALESENQTSETANLKSVVAGFDFNAV